MKTALVRHRYSVWVDVPAVSGDGWSKYPDYSAEEIERALRRALHANLEHPAIVEHGETVPVDTSSHAISSADVRNITATVGATSAEIDRLRAQNAQLKEALQECAEVLDNYSDGEYIDGRPVGNDALRMLGTIEEVLK